MKLNDKKHLNLLFPQWQGSGPSNILFKGAATLSNYLNEIEFQRISVPEEESLELAENILGYASVLSQLEEAVDFLKSFGPESILTIGGDCAVELAPVSWLNRQYGQDMALVWFDAHGDLNTPESSPSKHFHGMPLRTLLGEGDRQILSQCSSIVKPDQVIMAGLRVLDEPEREFLDNTHIDCISVDDLETDPGCLVKAIQEKGFSNVYVHIDLDVLDPEIYKNTKHPTPDGLTPETLCRAISRVSEKLNITGTSLLEFIPQKKQGLCEIRDIINCLTE